MDAHTPAYIVLLTITTARKCDRLVDEGRNHPGIRIGPQPYRVEWWSSGNLQATFDRALVRTSLAGMARRRDVLRLLEMASVQ